MRLSKKPKESENKKEVVEGLTRLVCTSKNHSTPLNGKILIFVGYFKIIYSKIYHHTFFNFPLSFR